MRQTSRCPATGRSARALSGAALAFAFLLVSFGSSSARTFYVSPGGNDTNPGTSPATAWATIQRANSTVQPGDVVQVADGTYSSIPRPAVDGTPGQRITFVGNLASPASVVLNGGATVSGRYLTIKGFKLNGALNLTGAFDSVAYCVLGGDRPQIQGADDCVIARCTANAQRFWIVGSETDSVTKAYRDTVVDCSFTLRPQSASDHTIRLKSFENGVIERCRFVIDVAAAATNASPTKLFHVRNTRFVDCFWDITNRCVSNCDESGYFVLRDYTQSNAFVRDTIILRGPGETQFFASASGSYPGTCMNNNFEDCLIKQVGPAAYGAGIVYQNGARWDTLSRCVVVSQASGVNFYSIDGPVLMENCTLVGMSPWNGVLSLDTEPWNGQLILRNNIIATGAGARRTKESAPLFTHLDKARGHIVSNHNVFFSSMSRDSAIYCWNVGPSAPGLGRPWCTALAADSNSVFGSPQFANTSSIEAFDAHLLQGSVAIGAAWGGGDAGAYPFSTVDIRLPGAVVDLALAEVHDTQLVLEWTATGDDGGSGTAAGYDVRWSLTPITSQSFGVANPIPTGPPRVAGTRESLTVTGLTPGTRYYFAVKVRDEADNWSALGNIVIADTDPFDATPPATIRDLSTTP